MKAGKVNFIKEHELAAADMILQNVDVNIAARLPEDAQKAWEYLEYRYGNLNKWNLKQEFKSLKMHDVNPVLFFDELDVLNAKNQRAGGTITDEDYFETILQNCNQIFYSSLIRDLRIKFDSGVTAESLLQAKNDFIKYYKATPETERTSVNHATMVVHHKAKKSCLKCKESRPTMRTRTGKMLIMDTHNTDQCKFELIKESSHYSSILNLYHDSGSSTTIINEPPTKVMQKKDINVFTASKQQAPEKATASGTINVGNLQIEALYVPSFSKNLLSATQFAREHGCTQIIEPWTGNLKILKDDKIVATGTCDEKSKHQNRLVR